MARERVCPECGAVISDLWEDYDPDVGIMCAGWYCDECDLSIPSEDQGDEDEWEKWNAPRG
jgi:hypothetical protein